MLQTVHETALQNTIIQVQTCVTIAHQHLKLLFHIQRGIEIETQIKLSNMKPHETISPFVKIH